MSKYRLFAILLMLCFLVSLLGAALPAAAAPERPTQTITYRAVDATQAVALIKAGQLDVYLFPVPRDIAAASLASPDVSFLLAPAGINDFILNPAVPKDPNKLNPFVSRRIRFAINYLVDRTFIVQQIFKGFAYEMYTFESPADPDYMTIADIVAKYKTPYNPELAAEIIEEEMLKLGATKGADGKWYYNGEPVTLNFVIRIEDERHDLGMMLADELERLGFTVNRLEMTFGEAIDLVYFTDPADLEWHIYTEGWGKGGLVKWDDSGPAFWGAPWFGLMPGWAEPGFWNYQNETIDELTMKLYMGLFSNMEERNELFREATELIIKEAVRIYVVTTLDAYPYAPEIRGVTEDRGAGLRSLYNLRELYIPGKPELQVAHLHVYTSRTLWGPVDARNWHFFDVYSVDPWSAVHDPWMWLHPFTGEVIPFRVSYEVETAGPNGTLTVPEDAFMWDPVNKKWAFVGTGVTAKSKVIYDLSQLLGTHWHHGKPVTWADILYDIYLFYEWTFAEDKMEVDPIWNAYFSDTLSYLKGFRIIDDTHLEVYVDYWHFDPNQIASFAQPPVTYFPWEVNFAVEKLVLDGTYAFNRYTASKLGVPQINYVLPDHAADAAEKLQELLAAGEYPSNVFKVGDKSYITLGEVEERYTASIGWINDKGHMVISQGPFYLQSFDAAGESLVMKAFEDPTYPFPPGKWVFGIFVKPVMERVFAPPVNVGAEASIIVDISKISVPYNVSLLYMVVDPATGETLYRGEATEVMPYRFEIVLSPDLTSELGPGTFELDLMLYSPEMALLDYRIEFFTILGGGALEQRIGQLEEQIGQLAEDLSELSASLEAVSGALADAIEELGSTLETALTEVHGTLDEMSSAISSLSGDVSAVSGDVTGLSESLADLKDRVGTLEGSVSGVNTMAMAAVVLIIVDIIIAVALAMRKT